jgi:hypothetical protein
MTPTRSCYLVNLNAANEMPFFTDWPAYTCPQGQRNIQPKALFTQYRQWAAVLEAAVVIFCVGADSVDLENFHDQTPAYDCCGVDKHCHGGAGSL